MLKTEPMSSGGKMRLRRCERDGRFWTRSTEKIDHWLPATAIADSGNGSATATAVSATIGETIEGSHLGFSLSPSSPDPNQNASKSPNRARARRKGRPSTTEYTPDFLEFWEAGLLHRGNKQPAFVAWGNVKGEMGVKFPEVKFIITRYNRWCETSQWQAGFALYVATWINARGWETEPEPHEFQARGRVAAARSDGNVEVLGDFLARGRQ